MRKAERERLEFRILRWLKRGAATTAELSGGLGLRAPRLHQTLLRMEREGKIKGERGGRKVVWSCQKS